MACARRAKTEIDYTFSVLPEGLQLTSEVGIGMIRWPFINEIMLFRDHWLLIAAGYGFGIPRQSFPSEAEERDVLGDTSGPSRAFGADEESATSRSCSM